MYAHAAARAWRGFTLIELMITLVVLVIVMMFAAEPFGALLAQVRMTTTVNSFVATLNLARSMAVTGKAPATICAANGDTCGSAADWGNGALLFSDLNASHSLTEGTETIRRRVDAPTNISITANVAFITFDRGGNATMVDSATPSKWVFCDPSGHTEPRRVSVLGSGVNYLYKPSGCSL